MLLSMFAGSDLLTSEAGSFFVLSFIKSKASKIAKNNYRLKIFNRGRVEARNIGIHFPDNDGSEYLSMHDVEDKFPYEVLHPQHGIEILAGISLGSKTKYRIKLIWDDNYKKRNEEEFFISI